MGYLEFHQVSVINRWGLTRSEEAGVLRFFNNPNVMEQMLLSEVYSHCRRQCIAGHVLLLQDTTELNYNSHNGRLRVNDPNLGVISDDKSTGLYVHPCLSLEASTGFPIGYSDIKLYQRRFNRPSAKQRKSTTLAIEDKESFRWIEGPEQSRSVLEKATKVTVIADRESDIYECLARISDPHTEVLIRTSWDRQLVGGGKVSDALETVEWQGGKEFFVQGNEKRTSRLVKAQLRWKQVEISKPLKKGKKRLEAYPEKVSIQVVEIKESPESAPPDEAPLHWRLWTSHPVKTLTDALQIVEWYTQRWWIEELFRLIKTQGFQIERSQLTRGAALKKMIILTLDQALKVLMLKQNRNNQKQIPANRCFSTQEQRCLEALEDQVEGNTLKQKNPFQKPSLAWATWIIARLGGWTPQDIKKRPPGVITLVRGLKNFNQRAEGFNLATRNLNINNNFSKRMPP